MSRLPVLLLALALAGCAAPDATDDGAANETPDSAAPALPAPIEDSQDVTGSGDPANLAGAPPCSTPSAQCYLYPFTLNGTAFIVADLSWGVPATDFDLYALQDGAVAISGASDITAGPGTSEHLEGELEAGDYELAVVAWSVAQDTFTVRATFSSGNATSAR